jgi:hypothetical protein
LKSHGKAGNGLRTSSHNIRAHKLCAAAVTKMALKRVVELLFYFSTLHKQHLKVQFQQTLLFITIVQINEHSLQSSELTGLGHRTTVSNVSHLASRLLIISPNYYYY